MDLNRIKLLFTELNNFLINYNDSSIASSKKMVGNAVDILESDESDDIKKKYIIEIYKLLYTGRGGLTEYYIWDNDYEIRMKLNEPLERIRNDLWSIMKEYVW